MSETSTRTSKILNIAFYQFVSIPKEDLPQLRLTLRDECRRIGIKGTILISHEGVNAFLAGEEHLVRDGLAWIRKHIDLGDVSIKESYSDFQPFTRMLVKIKKEIITMGFPEVNPAQTPGKRISAKQLKEWLDTGKDFTLLDTRNRYEIRLGTFKKAIDLKIDTFKAFPEKVKALPSEIKEKPVVTFCTGGIRCEKAVPLMDQMGFKEVYQLDDGILKYFEECGSEHYDGECFVFDHRVSLDPELQETGVVQCYHCRSTVTPEEQMLEAYSLGKSCPRCIDGKPTWAM